MRFIASALFVALWATACSASTPDDIALVSRVPQDVSPVVCDDGVNWTFGSALEKPTVLGAMLGFLQEEGVQCEATMSDVTLRDGGGRTATATGFPLLSNATMRRGESEAGCADGDNNVSADAFSGTIITDDPQVLTLAFDDGSEATLTRKASTFIDETCYDETGQWTGVAGSLAGRTGTYHWVEASLQIELVLVES